VDFHEILGVGRACNREELVKFGSDLKHILHIFLYTESKKNNPLSTNLQARYDPFCVKSAIKPQPTNNPL